MGSQSFTSPDITTAAVNGENTAGGIGISGISVNGNPTGGMPGVQGVSDTGPGVLGRSTTNHAVHGESSAGRGVVGISQTFVGVTGESTSLDGVFGVSQTGIGVHGQCKGSVAGVLGESDTGPGVQGQSRTNHAVHGESAAGRGVVGISQTFVGVTGESTSNEGVLGISQTGVGVHGKGGRLAGFFEGHVQVTGDFRGARVIAENVDCSGDVRLVNADCAEEFNVAGLDLAEPGSVMVLNDAGELAVSSHAFDRRVAGVVSGAGVYKPGIILDRQDTKAMRQPIGLIGKVFCKVDAQYSAIAVGDLLTTSPTPGHAMATSDPIKSFGAVIGKALRPLEEGQALIPILIALQ